MTRPSTSAPFGADGDTMAVITSFAERIDDLAGRTNELTKHLKAQVGKTAPGEIIGWVPGTIRLNGCILLLTRLSNALDTIRDLARQGAIRFPALSWVDAGHVPVQSGADLTESILRLEDDVEMLCVDLTFLVDGLRRHG